MRGSDCVQGAMFSYVDLEARIPEAHPLRKMKIAVDAILASMNDEFERRYSRIGRPSIAPERLLRASLLQVLYTIRSERQLMEQLDFNLLFRWFVGLGMDEHVWERTVFCANRERLLEKDLLRIFFERVLMLADSAGLISDEHFSVDGTMIDAWASHKSFKRKDQIDKGNDADGGSADGGRNRTVDFRGEKRSNQTHQSSTDSDARMYKKSPGSEPKLRYLGHALMENSNGLVVDVEITQATGRAEREAAKKMAARTIRRPGATLGADKGYDASEFVQTLHAMNITPHIAAKKRGSAMEEHVTQQDDYRISLKLRKRIEEIFGWVKTIGGFRKTRFIGTAKVQAQALLTFAAWNLTRMSTLLGWRGRPA